MSASIELRGLTKSYGDKRVLDGLDLEIVAGTVFGYVGPNGAGKTTTVRILCGLIDDFEGEARVGGADVREEPERLKHLVGYVPESIELYDVLTATELLQLVGRLRKLKQPLLDDRIERLLAAFGLEDQRHAALGSFSRGMKRKVLLSAALLHDPEVLFLDEPLSGLDVGSTILMKELVRGLADSGKTIFYCSHIMDVVERVCDRIVILDRGNIAADGTFEELRHGRHDRTLEAVFAEITRQDAASPRVGEVLAALRAQE